MKEHLYSAPLLCLLTAGVVAFGQAPTPGPTPAPASASIPGRPLKTTEAAIASTESPKLTRFNLNFPGGTPHEFVAAIEKATGRPLNVVIPDEFAAENIPALRMTQVTAPDLFRAMELASLKSVAYRTATYGGGSHSYQQLNTSISFQTSGPISDDSIWYFRGRQQPPDYSAWDTKPAPAKISRFYALAPYLEQGLKVEDITTAIQTGWKMLGEKETPSISFHKETKLLIAVGEPAKLETIDAVLNALRTAGQPDPGSFGDRVRKLIDQAAAAAPASVPPPTRVVEPQP
jgi:hypothetical protein